LTRFPPSGLSPQRLPARQFAGEGEFCRDVVQLAVGLLADLHEHRE
jgi:hypothetical protein